jgi:hypothetical protein
MRGGDGHVRPLVDLVCGHLDRKETGVKTLDQPRHGWTTVLRRQPARIVDGQPQGGYTNAFEIICCDCGDDPGLDYSEVSPGLQRIRGPYPIADGVAAYEKHVKLHPQPGRRHPGGMMTDAG